MRSLDRKLLRDREEIRGLRETAVQIQDRLHDLDDAVALADARDTALARAAAAEAELAELRGMLGTRSGRWFRAYHAARRALGRSS